MPRPLVKWGNALSRGPKGGDEEREVRPDQAGPGFGAPEAPSAPYYAQKAKTVLQARVLAEAEEYTSEKN